jgi:hypothetical protein
MDLHEAVRHGLAFGAERSRGVAAHRAASRFAGVVQHAGYLILEGDSWFSFPLHDEVTERLRDDFNYKTRSAAHHGDTAAQMANLPKQLEKLEQVFRDLAEDRHVARAILLSCGGNDVMDALGALMNPRAAGAGVWHPEVRRVVLREQLPIAIATLIGAVVEFSRSYFRQQVRPIIIHGYGNPVPDGRAYRVVLTLSGPWMKPVFARKGYVSAEPQPRPELQRNADAMADLMAEFNDAVLPGVRDAVNQQVGQPVVHYVDVRHALSGDLAGEAYEDDWKDELHPTGPGFGRVASLIDEAIRAAAPQVPPDLG